MAGLLHMLSSYFSVVKQYLKLFEHLFILFYVHGIQIELYVYSTFIDIWLKKFLKSVLTLR